MRKEWRSSSELKSWRRPASSAFMNQKMFILITTRSYYTNSAKSVIIEKFLNVSQENTNCFFGGLEEPTKPLSALFVPHFSRPRLNHPQTHLVNNLNVLEMTTACHVIERVDKLPIRRCQPSNEGTDHSLLYIQVDNDGSSVIYELEKCRKNFS